MSFAPLSVIDVQQLPSDFTRGVDLTPGEWIVPSGLGGEEMSSYASYCQDQRTECARRARLARSPEIATYWQGLAANWLRLAEQSQWQAALWATRESEQRCRWLLRVTRIAKQLPSWTRLIISRIFGTMRRLVKD